MEEVWKVIQDYEEYEISSYGNIRRDGKIRKPSSDINEHGYIRLRVNLCKNNREKHFGISRLVAVAFIPNPDNLPTVDHINRDPTDNRTENLRWASRHTQAMNRSMVLSASGNRNIYEQNNKFIVKIRRNNMIVFHESFKTIEEAIKVRDACLNANR